MRRRRTSMALNIYDNPEFFENDKITECSLRGLEGAAEWPSMRALVPDLSGRRVVDLGLRLWLVLPLGKRTRRGACAGAGCVGVMLARAMAAGAASRITYRRVGYMESLALPEASFDVADSSLALHYIDDLGKLLTTVHQALGAGRAPDLFDRAPESHMAPTHPGWRVECRRPQDMADRQVLGGRAAHNGLAGEGRREISPDDGDNAESADPDWIRSGSCGGMGADREPGDGEAGDGGRTRAAHVFIDRGSTHEGRGRVRELSGTLFAQKDRWRCRR